MHNRHGRDFNLQNYILLHSQHDALYEHLNTIQRSENTKISALTLLTSSPSVSSKGKQHSDLVGFRVRKDCPGGIDQLELQLASVNQQIKYVLTELLNEKDLKRDERCRKWIQRRLMDAEMELKGSKVRRLGFDNVVSG